MRNVNGLSQQFANSEGCLSWGAGGNLGEVQCDFEKYENKMCNLANGHAAQ